MQVGSRSQYTHDIDIGVGRTDMRVGSRSQYTHDIDIGVGRTDMRVGSRSQYTHDIDIGCREDGHASRLKISIHPQYVDMGGGSAATCRK